MGLPENTAAVRERERQAIELRNAKLTYSEIAAQVGFATAEGARQAILRCYQRDIVKNVEEIRENELTSLDALERAFYAKAIRGDEKAAEVLLKVKRERRKYIGGLEVAQEVKAEVTTTGADEFSSYLLGMADARKREQEREETE